MIRGREAAAITNALPRRSRHSLFRKLNMMLGGPAALWVFCGPSIPGKVSEAFNAMVKSW
jgi:hypothetical protein